MPIYLPKWLLRRCIVMWKKYGGKKFSFEDASTVLEDDSRMVAIILSELRKYGWLHVESDPSNPRKKLYQFKDSVMLEQMSKIEVT